MATINNYLTAVKEYLQECIDTGDYTHYRDEGDNWILMCFQNQVRDILKNHEDVHTPLHACRLWTAFRNAYCNRFKSRSERGYGIEIARSVDYYFDYCVDRKKPMEKCEIRKVYVDDDDFTYKTNDFINLIYSVGSYDDVFCEIVNAIKTVKITPADMKRAEEVDKLINSKDIVKADDICNDNTLKRINEYYKNYENKHDYFPCMCDCIEDYMDKYPEEFSCSRSDFDGYDPDSPYFESRLSYCYD